jgi:integrase
MTARHSISTAGARKPAKPKKPRPDYPLTPHPTGRWCKKILGKLHYFGPWDDPDAALAKWLDEKDDLLAGRIPCSRLAEDIVTLRKLCNAFLTTKVKLRDSGELSVHTWRDYYNVCESLITAFGPDRLLTDLLPEDFERLRATWSEKWGFVRVGNTINKVRIVFNYAYKNGLIDRPIRYGEGFKRPSRKTLRLARAKKGPRMFEAAELRRIVKQATQPMKAMVLLGINCALGNADVGQLPMNAIDMKNDWLTYPRGKTGIMRRCPLWPETVKALRAWLIIRPTPVKPEDSDLVFVTVKGGSWFKETSDNPISKEARKLLDELKINDNRNFYALRHTFETIGGESKDQVAVDSIMGHARDDMASIYRERISDDRLRAVTEYVRVWLFPPAEKGRERESAGVSAEEKPRLRIAQIPDEAASA